MKLTLKNIKHSEFASEETHCYQAGVYVDGKPMIDVSNDGHGGCDNQHPIKPFTYKDIEKVNKWCCDNLPKWKYDNKENDTDLEMWCGEEVNKFLTSKVLKRSMKRKILTLENNKIYETSYKGTKAITRDLLIKFINKYPDKQILNVMVFTKALNLYRKYS